MVPLLRIAVGLQLLAIWPVIAQQPRRWLVRGDTMGAPPGCSAAAGIAALATWFTAFNAADSAGLARVTPSRPEHFGVISIGKFTPAHSFVRIEALPALLRHARERGRQHERMVVQAVTFNGWQGRALGLGPVYFLRSADDLGPAARVGIGKGAYWCGQGLRKLNLAPRPTLPPGARMRSDQAYPDPG